MADFWYRCSIRLLPPLVYRLMRIWLATCRLRTHGEEQFKQVAKEQAVIALFWHYSFFYNFYFLRPYPSAIMVSASKDGEYIARLAKKFGHIPVRGSSNRGGASALRKCIKHLRKGRHIGIVADGSQGPARQLQTGCLLMAAKSGRPILPLVWAADRYIRIKSWDKTLLPKPFSRIVLLCGAPWYVPPHLDDKGLEEHRIGLQAQLNQLYEKAWQELGLPSHDGLPFDGIPQNNPVNKAHEVQKH